MTALLVSASRRLEDGSAPYPQSVSYGVVSGDSAEYEALIASADDKMYQFKLKHCEHTIRS